MTFCPVWSKLFNTDWQIDRQADRWTAREAWQSYLPLLAILQAHLQTQNNLPCHMVEWYQQCKMFTTMLKTSQSCNQWKTSTHIAHLRQQCRNSKCVIFQEKLLKVLMCYTFLRVRRRHNCSPVASFANCVMTLYVLKVHLQMFLSIPITQKCQILSCDTLLTNEW